MMMIITGIIGLGAGLALGGLFWGHYSDTVAKQVDEIDALNLNNLRLRGQCSELATQAHDAMAANSQSCKTASFSQEHLAEEIAAHRATRRKLAAERRKVTTLRKALGIFE
jgi:hypothetical protein